MGGLFNLFWLGLGIIVTCWAWRSHRPVEEDHCSNCGYDLRASQGRCPECGQTFTRPEDHIPLRDDWPADAILPRIPKPDETPCVVLTTDSNAQAQALRDQFEVRGIFSRVERPSRNTGNIYPYLPGIPQSWRVLVWSDDYAIAMEIRDKLIKPQPNPEVPEQSG